MHLNRSTVPSPSPTLESDVGAENDESKRWKVKLRAEVGDVVCTGLVGDEPRSDASRGGYG